MTTASLAHPVQAEVIERLTAEGPIGLTAASKIVKRHACTIARWAIYGIKLEDGRTVKLETYRLGGKLSTSRPALLRFIAAQQGVTGVASIQTPAERRAAGSEAEAVLDAAGIV